MQKRKTKKNFENEEKINTPQHPTQNKKLQKISLDLTKILNPNSTTPQRVSQINRTIIKEISSLVSKLNLNLFLTRFQNMDSKHKDFLIRSKTPITDDYSRVSFCCINLGPYRLPVYQPGTIMLMSGVQRKCPLEVFHKNCGQNGPILGMSCALFLAKFMSHLASNYFNMCKTEGHDPKEFIPHIYNNSLTNCLYYYSKEDAEQHGRLREIQKMLFRFDDRVMPMTREEEMQFYLNDVKAYKQAKADIPSKENDIENFRGEFDFYQNWDSLFNEGKTERIVERILPQFEIEILGKKGIFPDESCYGLVKEKIKELRNRFSVSHGIRRNDEYMNEFSEKDRGKISYETYRDTSFAMGRMRFRGGLTNISVLKSREPSFSMTSTERTIFLKVKDMEVEVKEYFKFDKLKLSYYQTVKESLRPFFRRQQISNLEIFKGDNRDLGKAFKRVSRLIQPVRKILEDSDIKMEHDELKQEMENFERILNKHKNLSSKISKAVASFRDGFLDGLKNEQKSNEIKKMIIGGEFYKEMEMLKYSKFEILAIRDSRILEAAFFMYSKFISSKNRRVDSLDKILEKLLIILSDYESYVLDLSERSPYKDSTSASKRSSKKAKSVQFSKKMIQNPYIPVFLKRKNDEIYSKYLTRITEFLEDYNVDRLNEILGEIDPCFEENEPAIELLSGIIKEKKNKSGCFLI